MLFSVDEFLFYKYMQNENHNNKIEGKSERALREERVLEFWKKENIFQKSVEKNKDGKTFVFFEGPPTANAKPALHHLEARAFKDVLPRYKTMQGFSVPRRAGWDTHGLPVELQIEKKLGLTSKKEIEQYGIAKFNTECRQSVFEFIEDWEVFTDRIGYWVDKDQAYYTFDTNYIESLWSIVGRVNEQDLLYKDYKVVPYCARCGTALASHELAQGYEDVKDLSVYVKFKIKPGQKINDHIVEDNTYLLAWTTTPWTLPGNIALAVGAEIEYVQVKIGDELYILAKDLLSKNFQEQAFEIKNNFSGSMIAGLNYEPVFAELKKSNNSQNAWQVYNTDFVTTTDGTGIVHIAPMYGNDDFELATKNNLPKIHTVNETGNFIQNIVPEFLKDRFVKDEQVAIDIIKDLAGRNILFKKEKYEHSYPHCWRCKTPLIYYARDSWYIKMSNLREKMISENKDINWEPSHIQSGRFGEWLDGIKDWAISRERYWGTPLPIWISEDGERIVVDSFETLKKYTKKSGNDYYVMRHGQSVGNVTELVSSRVDNNDPLTEQGIAQVKESLGSGPESVDIIIASPFMRTKQTAEIAQQKYGAEIYFDERLGELDAGDFEGKNWSDYHDYLYGHDQGKWFEHKIPGGESLADVLKRVGNLIYEIEQKYKNKKIMFVTHGGPAWLLYVASGEFMPDGKQYQVANSHVFVSDFKRFGNAEIRKLDFTPLPHNEKYLLDPHRPFIDDIVLEKDEKVFYRTKEVMDVWFDSGAMPFAQDHYLFRKQNLLSKVFTNEKTIGYPADFISEAIDQTRGWFYTLHAVGALVGWGKAYKNVICLGHLLDASGKKMSKSIGNIVDPWVMMDKYGVDTLRLWMYSVNQPGDSKNFDEKTVKELEGKILTLLYNVLSFYELYRDKDLEDQLMLKDLHSKIDNVLDGWILNRLNQLIINTTNNLDNYKLFEPVRELRDFISDLSTWYLRRSRDRLKDGDTGAKQTLYYVLKTISQIMAPFAPFTAEDIWQKLHTEKDEISVHLSSWPKPDDVDVELIEEMNLVRDLCTEGNALRKKINIPVRQPLASFTIKDVLPVNKQYFEIICDELNVKQTIVGTEYKLDTNITPELKREGVYRELVRALQDMRKSSGLTPDDIVSLTISKNAENLIKDFESDLKKIVQINEINFADGDNEVLIAEDVYRISIQK